MCSLSRKLQCFFLRVLVQSYSPLPKNDENNRSALTHCEYVCGRCVEATNAKIVLVSGRCYGNNIWISFKCSGWSDDDDVYDMYVYNQNAKDFTHASTLNWSDLSPPQLPLNTPFSICWSFHSCEYVCVSGLPSAYGQLRKFMAFPLWEYGICCRPLTVFPHISNDERYVCVCVWFSEWTEFNSGHK